MKKVISICTMSLVILAVTGCKKQVGRQEYASFIKNRDNGLAKTVAIDGWEYNVQYRPKEYVLLQEQGNTADKKRDGELTGIACFTIKIKRADNSVSPLRYNLESREMYDMRLNYFLNKAGKDITLLYDNRDTLYPSAYEFENNYNLAPEETILVAFALPAGRERPDKDMQLAFNDQAFRNGIIKVKIAKEDLENIPNLID